MFYNVIELLLYHLRMNATEAVHEYTYRCVRCLGTKLASNSHDDILFIHSCSIVIFYGHEMRCTCKIAQNPASLEHAIIHLGCTAHT
jgi:hypothetical protein